MPTGAQIRQDFIDFFEARDHTVVPSASLVPGNDPTLLFTNSGMVQFKDVFLGDASRAFVRAVDSQKCMRVAGKHNDLDDVGRDDTHHTFFEMLGNWSFGDYYKQKAIEWAWSLLTEVWGLPPERLFATVFQDDLGAIESDEEAATAWRAQAGFNRKHLIYSGRKDNFWEMADTGPCGPCSEIYVDLQPGTGDISLETLDTPRFVELWNLVFIQYNRRGPSQINPLPEAHVDTGMGLDRIAAILQQVDSNYRTDLLWPLIETIQTLTGHSDRIRERNFTPYRVIADHARAAAFLVADGVTPGNTGRNYVCRMIIRRASRFGTEIGLVDPFLATIADTVIRTYSDAYKELEVHRDVIANTLTNEESRFHQTIYAGMDHLNALIDTARTAGRKTLTGPETFDLYSTYGLPLEIARDVAREDGLEVDHSGFQHALESHRVASGAGTLVGEPSAVEDNDYLLLRETLQGAQKIGDEGVVHEPYGPPVMTAPLIAVVSHKGKRITQTKIGDHVGLILASTPFYVEGGGQVSDTGSIAAVNGGWKVSVTEVNRPVSGIMVHLGEVIEGSPREGDQAVASVNSDNRLSTMRNHTATHLLHRELRNLVGQHTYQAGSLVEPDRLRFDFKHDNALTRTEISQLAHRVNQAILNSHPIIISQEKYDRAVSRGATALFGEKYGDSVRTIQIGATDSVYSLELCGGTHVTNTSEIGTFIITSEVSVSAGTRRIEALTGRTALHHIEDSLYTLDDICAELQVVPKELAAKISQLLTSERVSQKARKGAELHLARIQFDALVAGKTEVRGVPVLASTVKVDDVSLLRKMTDWYYQRHPSGVVIIGAQIDTHARVIVRVSTDLLERGLHAGNLVAAISKAVGGHGGGKPTLAQGGGNQAARLDKALADARDMVASALAEHK